MIQSRLPFGVGTADYEESLQKVVRALKRGDAAPRRRGRLDPQAGNVRSNRISCAHAAVYASRGRGPNARMSRCQCELRVRLMADLQGLRGPPIEMSIRSSS